MNVQISADSTCDLSPELIQKWKLAIAPLYIVAGDQSYKDGVDFFPKDVFEHFDKTGQLCKTAAVNVADYTDFFTDLRKEADAVIHFCISSEFSSCYQNARLAAGEVGQVYVIDSRSLSSGIAVLILKACEMAQQGEKPEVIAEKVQGMVSKVDASFVIESLSYLRAGGRCSALASIGAKLLHIKPCIEVRDGKMEVGKKYRGTLAKTITEYAKDRLSDGESLDHSRIFVTVTSDPGMKAYADQLTEEVQKNAEFAEVLHCEAGSTISCHCGPLCIGILFLHQ